MSNDQLYEGIWTEYYDNVYPVKGYARNAKLVLSLLKKFNPKAKKLLELACGTGNYTFYFAKKYKVKATDTSKDMLTCAKKKCKKSKFAVLPMEKLNEKSSYDVVACMWESFRYLKSYKSVKDVLSRIHRALKPGGLFVVDFHHFPPSKYFMKDGPWVRLGKGIVRDTQQYTTKGDFDVRKSILLVVEGDKTKTVNLKRSPLLRISEKQMKSFLKQAGFDVVHFQRWFHKGVKNSMLFVAKKV